MGKPKGHKHATSPEREMYYARLTEMQEQCTALGLTFVQEMSELVRCWLADRKIEDPVPPPHEKRKYRRRKSKADASTDGYSTRTEGAS